MRAVIIKKKKQHLIAKLMVEQIIKKYDQIVGGIANVNHAKNSLSPNDFNTFYFLYKNQLDFQYFCFIYLF